MQTREGIQFVGIVFALAALAVLGLGRPVEADERGGVPHIHYVGSITLPGGGPLPLGGGTVPPPGGTDLSQLAPPGCFAPSQAAGLINYSSPRYEIIVIIRDTPQCVQAMQTFQPPPTAFPLPMGGSGAGYSFRRQ